MVGGCVTVKVSGHVIDRLTEKIVKNVNKTEIDHIGAYLCGRELSESSVVELLYGFTNVYCEILRFKILCFKVSQSEKWRLFCFVLSTSKL